MTTNVALVGLARDLAARAETGKPIRIGLIGAGEMGTDIVTQVARMQGIEVGALSARRLPNTFKAVRTAYGDEENAREARTESAMTSAIESGKIAVTDDNDLILSNPLLDVIIDATGIPEVGAQTGIKAIRNGKHLVMMNVEADVTIGPYLKAEADKHGVIYSLGAGDEPSSCMELIEFVSAMGHKVVAAGKGKNNPLNFDAIPDDYQEEVDRRNMNVRLLVEFVDGSKTMVEMAAIANATGLVPDIAGMHGPKAAIDELNRTLIPKEDGGVLNKT
ncbi:MAG TPA: homoserine dehydrogenase, partial [Ochrobactrum anthropi]|nr:homoserine dehydrogenase [Brucella anthropi]